MQNLTEQKKKSKFRETLLVTYKVVSFQRCWSWTKWRLLFTKIWRKRTENINELKKKNILKFTLFLITGNSKFQITKSPRRFSNLDGKFCKLYPQKITLTCASLVPRNNDPKEHWWTENCVSIMAVPFKNINAYRIVYGSTFQKYKR